MLKQWKSWFRFIPLSVCIFLVGTSATMALIIGKPHPVPTNLPKPKIPQVDVVTAEFASHRLRVHAQGAVRAKRQLDLVAELPGKITGTADGFVEGGYFAAGETLVAVDPRDYQYALTMAQAHVAEALRDLAEEQGRVRRAERDWRDLGSAEANNLFLRKPQLATAEALLEAARVAEQQARLNLQRTNISAPFVGRVKRRLVELGQYVTPGTIIATVYDTSVMEVRLPLTDQQAALIDLPFNNFNDSTDYPLVVATGIIAGKSYQWQGRIVRTEAGVDEQTRMHVAVAEFTSTEQKASLPLLNGLFVNVQISGRELQKTVALPRNALIRRNQIYTLDDNNKIISNSVDVLYVDENQVVVKDGLHPQDRVLIEKQDLVKPGSYVTPRLAEYDDGAPLKPTLAMSETTQ